MLDRGTDHIRVGPAPQTFVPSGGRTRPWRFERGDEWSLCLESCEGFSEFAGAAGFESDLAEAFGVGTGAVQQNGPLRGGHESSEGVGRTAWAVEGALDVATVFVSRGHVVERFQLVALRT